MQERCFSIAAVKDEDLLRILDAAAEPDPGRILDALIQATRAERGYLLTRDGIPVLRQMDPSEVRVSTSLLAKAVREGRPLVASSAELAAIESVRGLRRSSVLVVPLRNSGCAVYLDNGVFAQIGR